jgi:hypothetical protein
LEASLATELAPAPATPMLGVPNSLSQRPPALLTEGLAKNKMAIKATKK